MLIVIDKLTAYWSLLTAATAAPLLKFFSAKKLQKFIDKQILFPNGNNEKKKINIQFKDPDVGGVIGKGLYDVNWHANGLEDKKVTCLPETATGYLPLVSS